MKLAVIATATALLAIAANVSAQQKNLDTWRFEGGPDRFSEKKRCHLNSPIGKQLALSFQGGELYLVSNNLAAMVDGGNLKLRIDQNPVTESYTRNITANTAAADAYTISAGGAVFDQMLKGKVMSVRVVTSRGGLDQDFSLRTAAAAVKSYKQCLIEKDK